MSEFTASALPLPTERESLSGRVLPIIPFAIAPHWTPQQALAVYELLDDLREQIWQYYQRAIQELMAEHRITNDHDLSVSDSMF